MPSTNSKKGILVESSQNKGNVNEMKTENYLKFKIFKRRYRKWQEE